MNTSFQEVNVQNIILAFVGNQRAYNMRELKDKICSDIHGKLRDLEVVHIDHFLQGRLTMKKLSQLLGTNRTYLNIYFLQNGTTFLHYVNTIRLNKACDLIRLHPEDRLKTIALTVGYRSMSSFTRAFYNEFHQKPSQYRRSLKLHSMEFDLQKAISRNIEHLHTLIQQTLLHRHPDGASAIAEGAQECGVVCCFCNGEADEVRIETVSTDELLHRIQEAPAEIVAVTLGQPGGSATSEAASALPDDEVAGS